MRLDRIAYTLVASIAIVVVLIYLKSILIPFVFAVIVWFLIREVKVLINRSRFGAEKLPNWIKNLVAFAAILGVIVVVSKLLANNVEQMSHSLPQYQANVEEVVAQINEVANIDLEQELRAYSGEADFSGVIRDVFNSLSAAVGEIFMVILYVLFLMGEERMLPIKFRKLYQDKESYKSAREVVDDINESIGRYLSMKTLVSLITGTLSYIALLIIGIDFPMFWAILIFLLNYIPTIGSLVATLFPAFMALLQFGEPTPALIVLVTVGGIQMIIGNYIEPRLMGRTLNISALVVLLALAFWGVIWGVTGMFLSVPVTVILIILFSRFPSTRAIAVLLSGDGDVNK